MLTMYNTETEFRTHPRKIAILPLGALEQHGPHLPVGTDNLVSARWGEGIAEKLDAYLLPALPITSSIEHKRGGGTVSIKAETLGAVLRDIAFSLRDSGFEWLFLLNYHGGNWIVKPTVRQLNRELGTMSVMHVHPSVAAKRYNEVLTEPEGDIHAGEFETSLIQYLDPSFVRAELPRKRRVEHPQEFMDLLDIMDLTGDGVWGNPEHATPEKGAVIMDQLVEEAVRYIQRVMEAKAGAS